MQKSTINCDLCGQLTAREIRRTKPIGKGEKIVIIENVPMISCRNCGHDYFSIEVARVLDDIRTNPHVQTARKTYAVFEFA